MTYKSTNFFIINATPMRQHLKRKKLNKKSKSKEMFHLSRTQYTILVKHCIQQWPWKSTNIFINNALSGLRFTKLSSIYYLHYIKFNLFTPYIHTDKHTDKQTNTHTHTHTRTHTHTHIYIYIYIFICI